MGFLRAAGAARAGRSGLDHALGGDELRRELGQEPSHVIRHERRYEHGHELGQRCAAGAILILSFVLALLSISCSTNSSTKVLANHIAYITLPDFGSVLMLQINGTTGEITAETQTPQVQGTSPTGLALLPSKNFLYTANSRANTISTYNVAADGTLSLDGPPMQGNQAEGPNVALIDPSGRYLLVSNNFSNNISVFQIAAATGLLTEVSGSPFPANANPTAMVFAPSGNFLYVTNPSIKTVTAFSFVNGALTQLATSPVISGSGPSDLVIDLSGRFLYVANVSAINPQPYAATVGNISGFNIDSTTGELTPISGSPFISTNGVGPSALVIDPQGELLYAVTPGTSFSIWCFSINESNGQLAAEADSPFSVPAGGLFALFDPSGNYLYVGSNTAINGYTYSTSSGDVTAVTGKAFTTGVSPGKMVFSQ
jgi:6-phosphogluconolactonase (cycloisomerase 2 family)